LYFKGRKGEDSMFKVWSTVFVLVVFSTGVSLADISNGSFEAGLTGWSYTNEYVGTVTEHYNGGSVEEVTEWEPTDGSYYALLTDGSQNAHIQLYQTFTASAGDVLTFDYFWDSGDYSPYTDTGTGKLLLGGVGGTLVESFFSESVTGHPNYWGSAWTQDSYTFLNTDTYTLLIETWNGGDSGLPSFVGIDNVAFNAINPVVPVPGAFLLGMLGLSAAGLRLRRFV
jgi:hypothetical protein